MVLRKGCVVCVGLYTVLMLLEFRGFEVSRRRWWCFFLIYIYVVVFVVRVFEERTSSLVKRGERLKMGVRNK